MGSNLHELHIFYFRLMSKLKSKFEFIKKKKIYRYVLQEKDFMKLVEKDYAWCTEELKKIAAQFAEKRIVSMLEGGYVMTSLARSVGAHLRSLADL